MTEKNDLMERVISLCKRRGFIFPGSEIYGGLANSYDYGPLGTELKNNIKKLWWKMFVQERMDMVGLDAALIMNSKVWEASGHLINFSDPLVECKKCHHRFRADDEVPGLEYTSMRDNGLGGKGGEVSFNINTECPNCKEKGTLGDFVEFNLMFKTSLGPINQTSLIQKYYETSDTNEKNSLLEQIKKTTVYFRPETAQAIFVDFKLIQETSRQKVPFGVAQIGKAFRNEITPGNFIFRTREFEQMEIEYFVHPNEWEKHFEDWKNELVKWIKAVGIDESKIHYVEIDDKDRAFYSKRTIDVEFEYPFGQKELYGLAYRTDYDLTQHQNASTKELMYTDPKTNEKYVPHVIEPSLGVDRTLLAVLLSAYTESEARSGKDDAVHEKEVTLKLPKALAPIKVAILPLSKKEPLLGQSNSIFQTLSKHWMCQYDETGSIGKRYRRQDEIGTPYCITVDFETENDKSVTVRDRDTMAQERVKIEELVNYFKERLES